MANTWENYPEGPDSEPAPEAPTSWAVYGEDDFEPPTGPRRTPDGRLLPSVPRRTPQDPRPDAVPDPTPDDDRHDRPSWKPALGAFMVIVMVIGFLGMLLSLRPQPQQPVKIEGYARPGLPNVRSVTLPEQVDDWQRGTLTRGQGPYLVVFTDYTRDHQDVTILGSITGDPDPLRGMQRPPHHPDAEIACDTVTGTADRRVCVIPLDEGQLTVTSDDSALSVDDLGTFTAELARTLT
ncbi:hypothetical protein AADG42_14265 [Ammonicoccus fulvus]|uniref:DUF4245 domain-containing protein n=1 Tax=Ammonicoccus fulvus TaxID=3138240 RepID=A0ABZ3FUC6_9ACTN